MNPENFDKLPPELQARINNIVNQAALNQQAPAPAAQAPGPQAAAPNQEAAVTKPPSLMDHVVALRQELAHVSMQIQAVGQVTEAVGNAVGELYQMFQVQTQPSNYSSAFQAQEVDDEY